MPYAVGGQWQLSSGIPANLVVPAGDPVKFDTQINLDSTDPTITLTDGVFQFVTPGVYLVEWFVVTQTALTNDGIKFSLVATTGTTGTPVVYPSTTSFKTGTLSGSAIVDIKEVTEVNPSPPPANLSFVTNIQLRNDTGADVSLAINTDILANITITKIVPQQLDGLEAILSTGTSVGDGDRVAYNTKYTTFASDKVSLNTTTDVGLFTTNVAGIYIFDWSVSVGGSGTLPITGIEFNLRDADTPANVVGRSAAPSVTPQYITGTAIVSAAVGQNFELVNATGADLQYDTAAIKSSMRVFTVV